MKALFPAAAALLLAAGCATTDDRDAAANAATAGDAGASAVAAADVPDTEIFIGELYAEGRGWAGRSFKNATNHPGYDNQPWFLPGKAAFFYVAAAENGKTDIWRYDIAGSNKQLLFSSPEASEYSPKMSPDGKHISYIQENPAGDVTRVHQRTADGSDAGVAVADFAPLGYYVWLDGGAALGVYYRSEPGTLYRVDIASGETTKLFENIGRALHADPEGAHLWFAAAGGERDADAPAGPVTVMRYDSNGGEITKLFTLPGAADEFAVIFAVSGDAEGFIAADSGTLYYRDAGAAEWNPAGDLAGAGIDNASRIAVSGDHKWIAVVGEVGEIDDLQ